MKRGKNGDRFRKDIEDQSRLQENKEMLMPVSQLTLKNTAKKFKMK